MNRKIKKMYTMKRIISEEREIDGDEWVNVWLYGFVGRSWREFDYGCGGKFYDSILI